MHRLDTREIPKIILNLENDNCSHCQWFCTNSQKGYGQNDDNVSILHDEKELIIYVIFICLYNYTKEQCFFGLVFEINDESKKHEHCAMRKK